MLDLDIPMPSLNVYLHTVSLVSHPSLVSYCWMRMVMARLCTGYSTIYNIYNNLPGGILQIQQSTWWDIWYLSIDTNETITKELLTNKTKYQPYCRYKEPSIKKGYSTIYNIFNNLPGEILQIQQSTRWDIWYLSIDTSETITKSKGPARRNYIKHQSREREERWAKRNKSFARR